MLNGISQRMDAGSLFASRPRNAMTARVAGASSFHIAAAATDLIALCPATIAKEPTCPGGDVRLGIQPIKHSIQGTTQKAWAYDMIRLAAEKPDGKGLGVFDLCRCDECSDMNSKEALGIMRKFPDPRAILAQTSQRAS
ncbi:hypothetical protein AB3Y40_12620 [Yoonia sp. R2331]|uniref:hypothetical protein n=1 Tax=Yoonia sp. R2331 TaxID=3237238 RepID=UPI0034E44D28